MKEVWRKVTRAASLLVLCAAFAAGQTSLDITIVRGYDGSAVAGEAFPLTLLLDNTGGQEASLRLAASDEDGRLIQRSTTVSAGVSRVVTMLMPAGDRFTGWLTVESEKKCSFTGSIDGTAVPGSRDANLWRVNLNGSLEGAARMVALGGRARQIAGALRMQAGFYQSLIVDGHPTYVGSLDDRFAPDTWLAWSGVHTILWTEPDFVRMPNPAQLQALLRWVETGGRLVILSAHRQDALLAPEFAKHLPIRAFTSRLVDYPAPKSSAFKHRGMRLEASEIARDAEEHPCTRAIMIEFNWGERAVRYERRLGLGRIVVAAFNPLAYDTGNRDHLVDALRVAGGLNVHEQNLNNFDYPAGGGGAFGGGVFHKQLQNDNVLTPSLGLYILLGIFFVMLIGPLDYGMLKKRGLLKWSPVTLLIYTALFTAASIGATLLLFAPDEEINRIAFLDFTENDAGEELVSGHLFHGIYAPVGGTYDLDIEGFDQVSAIAPQDTRDAYRYSTGIRSVPMSWKGPGRQTANLTLGFNAFRELTTRLAGAPDGNVAVDVEEKPGRLVIKITNGLSSRLSYGLLAIYGGAIAVEAIDPGESVEVPVDLKKDPPSLNYYNRRRGGTLRGRTERRNPDFSWARHQQLLSLGSEHGRKSWETRLSWEVGRARRGDTAIFLALTDQLPFDDPLEDVAPGFTKVMVRRCVTVPRK